MSVTYKKIRPPCLVEHHRLDTYTNQALKKWKLVLKKEEPKKLIGYDSVSIRDPDAAFENILKTRKRKDLSIVLQAVRVTRIVELTEQQRHKLNAYLI